MPEIKPRTISDDTKRHLLMGLAVLLIANCVFLLFTGSKVYQNGIQEHAKTYGNLGPVWLAHSALLLFFVGLFIGAGINSVSQSKDKYWDILVSKLSFYTALFSSIYIIVWNWIYKIPISIPVLVLSVISLALYGISRPKSVEAPKKDNQKKIKEEYERLKRSRKGSKKA